MEFPVSKIAQFQIYKEHDKISFPLVYSYLIYLRILRLASHSLPKSLLTFLQAIKLYFKTNIKSTYSGKSTAGYA